MAAADTFPIALDFGSALTSQSGVAVFRLLGGEEIRRIVAPYERIFDGAGAQRPRSEAEAVLDFHDRMQGDFFTFTDPVLERSTSVYFDAPPRVVAAGYERFDISVRLRAAAGKPLASYPSTPLLSIPLNPVDVGDGLVFFYSGYGYKITGTGVSTAQLDGVSSSTSENFSVPLGAHALKVLPNTANITKLEIVH